MRTACQLARKVLTTAGESLRVGMTTDEIDQLVLELCIEHNAYPSPLNYRGFPKAVCTSVNNVICHGIPDSRPLVDGDIINVSKNSNYEKQQEITTPLTIKLFKIKYIPFVQLSF